MRILVSKIALTETPCKCGCKRMFVPAHLKNVYATDGCSLRAKLAGAKRRNAAKKLKSEGKSL